MKYLTDKHACMHASVSLEAILKKLKVTFSSQGYKGRTGVVGLVLM
jgi:hypothetical protein